MSSLHSAPVAKSSAHQCGPLDLSLSSKSKLNDLPETAQHQQMTPLDLNLNDQNLLIRNLIIQNELEQQLMLKQCHYQQQRHQLQQQSPKIRQTDNINNNNNNSYYINDCRKSNVNHRGLGFAAVPTCQSATITTTTATETSYLSNLTILQSNVYPAPICSTKYNNATDLQSKSISCSQTDLNNNLKQNDITLKLNNSESSKALSLNPTLATAAKFLMQSSANLPSSLTSSSSSSSPSSTLSSQASSPSCSIIFNNVQQQQSRPISSCSFNNQNPFIANNNSQSLIQQSGNLYQQQLSLCNGNNIQSHTYLSPNGFNLMTNQDFQTNQLTQDAKSMIDKQREFNVTGKKASAPRARRKTSATTAIKNANKSKCSMSQQRRQSSASASSSVSASSSENSANDQQQPQQQQREQHQLRAHLCNQCGRSFSRSDMLTRHSRLHSGLKPYQCGKCHQVFSRSDHLSTHERTHTGEKPFQCKHCSYSACRRDMITRHMRTHNNNQNHYNSITSKPKLSPISTANSNLNSPAVPSPILTTSTNDIFSDINQNMQLQQQQEQQTMSL